MKMEIDVTDFTDQLKVSKSIDGKDAIPVSLIKQLTEKHCKPNYRLSYLKTLR